jgi:hypothetical protein
MNRPRLVRVLRISWTGFWGIAAVLLVVLWVHSYWARDAIWGWLPIPLYFQIDSDRGVIHSIVNQENAKTRISVDSTYTVVKPDPWVIHLYKNPRFGWWLDLAAPHLLLILCSVATVFAPWFSFKRFSLRTLLVATTIIAVGLGTVAWLSR